MTEQNKKIRRIIKTIFVVVGLVLLCALALILTYLFLIQRSTGKVYTSGEERGYVLHVPEGYQEDMPIPLVISIHGFAEWPQHQQKMTHWDELAEDNNFIVVYPSGSEVPKHWRSSDGEELTDVQFISDLIDQLQTQYNIDEDRIYANGLSNGGGMSYMLSCKLSDRIAAFGGVAGAYLLPTEDCDLERPVPAILFHGNNDPIVPFEGGPSDAFEIPFPVVSDWVQALAERNGCDSIPIEIPKPGEASGVHYTHCTQNAEVVYYIIDGGGHTWPGGDSLPKWIAGHTTQDIDATRLMWEFFSQHPLNDDSQP